MAARRLLGCLAALALCALPACKDKDDASKTKPGTIDARCERLGKVCGDQVKHVEKIIDECKQAAKKQAEKGCTDKAIAAYDCYEKELCARTDKVWALDDLRVLSERQSKCVPERTAAESCVGK